MRWVQALAILITVSPSVWSQAQDQSNGGVVTIDYEAIRQTRVVPAIQIHENITLDGKLDEPAWQNAPMAADFLQWEPRPGAPATDRTEVRFLYDEDNLYVGANCYDSLPGHLIVNELKEDFQGTESDGFSLSIDALHDRRSGFIFGTNPAGAKRDMQVANDGAQVNMDWDGVWDVKVTTHEKGWTAEYVIPFKTLRFKELENQEWGVNMLRRVRRSNEDSFWSPVPRRYRGTRMSAAGTLTGIKGIRQGRNLKIKPYVIAGVTAVRSGNELKTSFDPDGGVDLKYGLTPSLTMDLTYRTDFSQVEVDTQQVNLTRFNLFFPEKREFFLENAATFGLNGGTNENVIPFFSRRIGLNAAGTPIPIVGGARLSGRISKFDLGFLTMKTERLGVTPSNNFAVGRIKRNLLKNSWIGVLATHRNSGAASDHNQVIGADTHFQFFDKLEFDAYLFRSRTPGKNGKDQARKLEIAWRGDELAIGTDIQTVQTNFNPEVGFIRRRDNTKYSGELTWKPRPRRSRTIRNWVFETNYDYFASGLGKVETRTNRLHFGIFFQNNATFNVSTLDTFDRLRTPFTLRSNVQVQPGDYGYRTHSVDYTSDRSRTIAGNATLSWGRFWNGDQLNWTGGLLLKPSYHLNFDLTYSRNHVDLPQGQFTTNLVGSRFLYAFSSRMFLNAFVQYNTDTHQISSNIRFNITHHPLSDLYLVYNDRRDTVSGQLLERSFIVKLTNLFNF